MSNEASGGPVGAVVLDETSSTMETESSSSPRDQAARDADHSTSPGSQQQQQQHPQQSDSLLTDSENTNNENRVIEMDRSVANLSENVTAMEAESSTGVTAEVKNSVSSVEIDKDKGTEVKSGEEDEKVVEKGDKYAEHVTYSEQGEAIYTDPETKFRYKWCKVKNEWVPEVETDRSESNPYENEHYRWCHEKKEWIPKETPKETEHYRWCDETKQWIPKAEQKSSEDDRTYSVENGVHLYTDKDGAIYFWDEAKKAWFPRVDDHFMAVYQLNYGFIDNTSDGKPDEPTAAVEPEQKESQQSEETDEESSKVKGKKRKAPPEPPKWFDLKPEHNTKMYVSNLPLDITEEEFGELMGKCGMILKDPRTNKLKLKLYRDANGMLKGDGLCHYIKIESVNLALDILDNYDVRGHKIRVQRAEFQLKGEYNPSLKPKVKKKEKEKMRKMQESLFDWRPEKLRGERSKHERIVILKNLFEPALFEREVHLLLEYQNDLREECNKCGTCRRVVLFDRHPEGVAQVTMSDPEEADLVVKLMHGRFFGQRKLTAEIWDGRTKYRVAETEADTNKRLGNWEKYLEKGEEEVEKTSEKPVAVERKSEGETEAPSEQGESLIEKQEHSSEPSESQTKQPNPNILAEKVDEPAMDLAKDNPPEQELPKESAD
ncbi:HIV Tat-specific factor 1 homolog [Sabethes cyaneus]|uniref:HIV Tat-specific factor 1 homolog n=1 Tax=Sabethes cyaneus TaxID=53552 RepID=UPI00237E2D73|nr:HIV Tat-specific factor 1 homolog [Sabethes cyaneus]